jgi:hypothetical protein
MIDWILVATVTGPVIGVAVGVALTRAIEGKARVVVHYGHAAAFRITNVDEPFSVHTHNVVVRNAGKRPAHNVRCGHAVLPPNVTLYPDKDHHIVSLPGGTQELLMPELLPGEEVTIAYLYYPPLMWNQVNTYVKSDEGFAKVITVLPQQQYPRWFNNTAALLMLIGLVTTCYLAVLMARWVAERM